MSDQMVRFLSDRAIWHRQKLDDQSGWLWEATFRVQRTFLPDDPAACEAPDLRDALYAAMEAADARPVAA